MKFVHDILGRINKVFRSACSATRKERKETIAMKSAQKRKRSPVASGEKESSSVLTGTVPGMQSATENDTGTSRNQPPNIDTSTEFECPICSDRIEDV
ncbi:hypothetical protein AVEN_128665-1 [Araneus ventricosus]|uniref:Uncharacterized protein n=1 Tax=Araneus ventricosus TaxID=182803 RepID=A0A4Y2SYH9_ARAVE|nr:hypothetical protein AVEN_128665-1 [Araneus ventricosus]